MVSANLVALALSTVHPRQVAWLSPAGCTCWVLMSVLSTVAVAKRLDTYLLEHREHNEQTAPDSGLVATRRTMAR